MDGPALSRRERQILAAIEADLKADTGLDRRLSTMTLGRLWRLWLQVCSVTGSTAVFLTACSLGLMTVAVQVDSVPVLALFGLFWLATLIALVGLVGRRLLPH
ncbi:hypothetical protein [Kitasatospora sp. GP82]|uniref:hypothetical protein n=1 Tax=Kitasatospora sp. GP82 TaxID=3035089 RepID=UPI002474F2A7|nr:hypothetical protein [Kitasatospora sp. GP82]MDH6125006.1 hypothetical protein [Kitasatospora sp. GP82]